MTISGPIAGLLACTVTYLFTAIGSALVFILPSNWLTDHTHPAHTIVVAIASGMMLAAVMELSGEAVDISRAAGISTAIVAQLVGFTLAAVVLLGFDRVLQMDCTQSLTAKHASASASSGYTRSRPGHSNASDQAGLLADHADDLEHAHHLLTPVPLDNTPAAAAAAAAVSSLPATSPANAPYPHKPQRATSGSVQALHSASHAQSVSSGPTPLSSASQAGGALLINTPSSEAAHHARAAALRVARGRLMVLTLALQHIPEALACGVAFAAVDAAQSEAAADEAWATALALTAAIALQDIPEGAMAAVVCRAHLGYSAKKAFFVGQLTGALQPLCGVLGALAVLAVQAILPHALVFAAAAMLFVVLRDMMPDVLESPEHEPEDEAARSRTKRVLIMFGACGGMAALSEALGAVTM